MVGAGVAEDKGHPSRGPHSHLLPSLLPMHSRVPLGKDDRLASLEVVVQIHDEGEVRLLTSCC